MARVGIVPGQRPAGDYFIEVRFRVVRRRHRTGAVERSLARRLHRVMNSDTRLSSSNPGRRYSCH